MPSPATPALRVAECGGCGQLFAVYATRGSVGCPNCGHASDLADLSVAELGVAAPIEVKVEPPAATIPTPAPVAAERAPTVAEWLLRNDQPAAPPEHQPEPAPTTKPSLAESLGWSGGAKGSRLDLESPAELARDFRFDFGATPLTEQPAPESPRAAMDALATDRGPDAASPEPVTPASLDWGASPAAARRTWAGPLSALAGLLMIAVPAAYLAFAPANDPPSVAAANRDARRTLSAAPEASPPPSPAERSPAEPDPFARATRAAVPIVDPDTRPASFNAPEKPLAEPAEDALPPLPPASAAPADRYAPAGADRYAPLPPAEFEPDPAPPAEFPAPPTATPTATPPAAMPAADTPPEAAPAAPAVGLQNAPRTSVAELAAAAAAAAPAGAGFSAGTLADPAQVSVMGQHYARLCFLSQALTLLDPAASGPDAATAKLEAVDVFAKVFRSARVRAESRQIAVPWIGWTGRPHGGVFFAGTPVDVSREGSVFTYKFDVAGAQVPVVMAAELDPQRFVNLSASEVGVLGIVVERPREWIAGYEGDAERVVWAQTAMPLAAAVDP